MRAQLNHVLFSWSKKPRDEIVILEKMCSFPESRPGAMIHKDKM